MNQSEMRSLYVANGVYEDYKELRDRSHESEDEREERLREEERLRLLKYQVRLNLNQEYKKHKQALSCI